MKLTRFFVLHSLRDMWRNRTRTVFALICVATGVAAVVALRTLAFMVADELTEDLAQVNRGDMRIYASRNVPELVELSTQRNPVFRRAVLDGIRSWAGEQSVQLTIARLNNSAQLRKLVSGRSEVTSQLPVLTLFVEPEQYPFYDTITVTAPAGTSFSGVLGGGTELQAIASVLLPKLGTVASVTATSGVSPGSALLRADLAITGYPLYVVAHPRPLVIPGSLAHDDRFALVVGDYVRLGASDTLYRVTGIVPSSSESILSIPQMILFNYRYVYVPFSDLPLHGEAALPDQIFGRLPLGQDANSTEATLLRYLYANFDIETDLSTTLRIDTVPKLRKENEIVADVVDDTILVMGLSSLLIGGIGIINTMLVIVSRRMLEIAVLKTVGLKGYRVTVLFLVESLLMGLLGSLLGIAVGIVLSYAIRDIGERAFSLSLQWRLYPEAVFSGLFLGVIVTVLFGLLPTLIAGQVRPAIVLRPNETPMPTAGLLQTLITLIVMITILGLLVNTVVEEALQFDPIYMLTGAGGLVGIFAGIITANTRLGKPLPPYFVFRMSPRHASLERRMLGTAGTLFGRFVRRHSVSQDEKGRIALTNGVRILREVVLLYGATAIGLVLSSVLALIASELWRPFGIGDVTPASHAVEALAARHWAWLGAWGLLALLVAILIRRLSQELVSVIALASLGATFGGALGIAAAVVLRSLPGVWQVLTNISTGLLLVEGAMAILGTVYIGYWILIWLVSKLSGAVLMRLVSFAVGAFGAGAAFAVASLGSLLLGFGVGLLVLSGLSYPVVRRMQSTSAPLPNSGVVPNPRPSQRASGRAGYLIMALSVVLAAGGPLLALSTGVSAAAMLAVVTLSLGFIGWRGFFRQYAVDGRLVLREMAGRRGRAASTLLGLSVGIAGLSIVSLTTGAASHLLRFQLGEQTEGNLLVISQTEQREDIRERLDNTAEVDSYSQFALYQAVLLSVNGRPVEARTPPPFHGGSEQEDEDEPEPGVRMALSVRDTLANLPAYDMKEGVPLAPGDEGSHKIMMRETRGFTEAYDIHPGDRLMLQFENAPGKDDDVLIRLTVVGIVGRQSEEAGLGDQFFLVPPDTLPPTIDAENAMTVVMVDETSGANMDVVLGRMADIPGAIAIDLRALTELLENLIEQLQAIPTLVAWLALVAGTAIIANTVALATQERRRHIGVMKAVGLKGRRVLAMLMIENGLIGFLAGVIGATVGLLVTVILVLNSNSPQELRDTIDFASIAGLLLMAIGVAIGAATLSAWSAASEKPMNVLRYE